MNALDRAEGFDVLYIPPYRDDQVAEPSVLAVAADRCRANRAVLLPDSPRAWSTVDDARNGVEEVRATLGDAAKDAALYFTDLKVPGGNGHKNLVSACGAVAGAIARNDPRMGWGRRPRGSRP